MDEDIYIQESYNSDKIVTGILIDEKRKDLGYKYLHRVNTNLHAFTDRAYQHAQMEGFVNRTGVTIYLKRSNNTLISIPPEEASRRIPTYEYFSSTEVPNPFTFRSMTSTANIHMNTEPTLADIQNQTPQAKMHSTLARKGARNSKGGEIATWCNDYAVSLDYIAEHESGMMIPETDILLFTDFKTAITVNHPAHTKAAADWLNSPGVSIVVEVPMGSAEFYYTNLGGNIITLNTTHSPAQKDLGTAYVSTYCSISETPVTKEYAVRDLLNNTSINSIRLYDSKISAEREDRLARTDIQLSKHKEKMEMLKEEEDRAQAKARMELEIVNSELKEAKLHVAEQKKLLSAEKEKIQTEQRWEKAKSKTSILVKALEVGAAVIGVSVTLFTILKTLFSKTTAVMGMAAKFSIPLVGLLAIF